VRSERASVIKYAPLRPQEEQARRLGVDIRDVLETIRECFDSSDCGRSFAAALAHNRLTLAQGERRDFVVVDHAGGIHAIGKRILGLSAALIRARLSDLAREGLPTVEQTRQRINAIEGSRKKQDLEKGLHARREQQRLPTPAIAMNPPSMKRLQTTEDQPDWTARPTFPSFTVGQHELVSPECVPSLNREIAPELPVCEFDEARKALPPGPVLSTETDLASDRPELEVEHAQSARRKSAGLADVLKKQFRAVVQALVRREPSPESQTRRRRRGETVGGFQSAARTLLRPIIRLPGISRTIAFLNGTVPWLHLWEWNDTSDHVLEDEPTSTTGDHLSPHP